MIFNLDKKIREFLYIVKDVNTEMGFESYVIGGIVRDSIMGRLSSDLDIVCVGSGIELAHAIASRLPIVPNVTVYKRFGTAMFHFKGIQIEFVGARKESYRSDSRKPIVENGTLEDDQNRRDFTINAMALSLNEHNFGELLDPFGGLKDIRNRIIKTPLEPGSTFSDDPLRMMRAIRFATQLNFQIEKNTFEGIKKYKSRIRIISQERITTELNKIMLSAKPSIGFKLLFDSGLLRIIFPKLADLQGVDGQNGKFHKDNFYHTIKVLDNVAEKSDNLWLRWAALLHDIGKPATKRFEKEHGWTFHGHDAVGAIMIPRIFRKLKLPLGEEMRYVRKLVRLHLRPIGFEKDDVTDSGIRRLLFDAGDDIDDLMLLCSADITSKIPEKVKRYLENFNVVRKRLKEVEESDKIRNWQPPISGDIIMKTFGIPPSRQIGVIKTAIREAILEGEIKNDYDEAYKFMLEKGKELNLEPK